MYVLVLIMMFEGRIKVQAFDGLFMDVKSCNQLATEMEERLMSTHIVSKYQKVRNDRHRRRSQKAHKDQTRAIL